MNRGKNDGKITLQNINELKKWTKGALGLTNAGGTPIRGYTVTLC
jgi:hypothetical protein